MAYCSSNARTANSSVAEVENDIGRRRGAWLHPRFMVQLYGRCSMTAVTGVALLQAGEGGAVQYKSSYMFSNITNSHGVLSYAAFIVSLYCSVDSPGVLPWSRHGNRSPKKDHTPVITWRPALSSSTSSVAERREETLNIGRH